MNKDLEAKVEERKRDAEDRKIAFKAYAITKKKGKYESGLENGKAFEKITFTDFATFKIEDYTRWPTDIQDGGTEDRRTHIYYLKGDLPGREVFRMINGDILIYRPNNSWENQLEEFYLRLLKEDKDEVARKKKKLEEAEEASLMDRFKL